MSKNINQIFGTNPATSMEDTDLMYLGRAPYGLTNDMAILWSDIIISIGGEFLKKANNFTDVANPAEAFKNLGTGTGQSLVINDGDFTAGVYQIPVPFPAFIVCNNLSPGQEIRLPVCDTPFDSPALGQGPILKMIDCGATSIALSDGTVIDNLEGFEQSRYLCSDKSTAEGAYTIESEVYLVNSVSGRIELHSPENTVYVGTSTSTGQITGSITNPYPTISAAMAAISPSPTRPFKIICDPGIYTETNLVLKQNVTIQGNQSSLTVSGSLTLDAGWSAGGMLYIDNFGSLSLPANVTFDFTVAPFALFVFSNHIISSNTTLDVKGAIFISKNNFGFSNEIDYKVEQCYGAIQGGASGSIEITDVGNYSIVGMTEIGNCKATWTQSGTMILFHEASKVIGTTLYKSTGSGNLIVQEKGVTHVGSLTLDNGTGGGSVNLSANTLTELPILLNGAIYNPDSISDAMLANKYFTPINYTPVSGGPGSWAADSVTGNLAGIDEALASMPSMTAAYAEMYFQANSTPTTFSGVDTPTKVLASAYNTGEIQGFTQVGGTLTYTGTENRTVQVTAMLTATYEGTSQNTSFYISQNGSIVAKSKQSSMIGVVTPSPLPLPVQATLSLVNGDTIELWVENNDNSNAIVVYDLNYNVSPMNASSPTTISPSYGEMYFQDNATVTPIAAVNTPVKVVATYNADELKDFNHASGALTYLSSTNKKFVVTCDLTATYAGTAQNTSFYIAVNGSVVAKSKQKTFIGAVTPGDQPNPVQAIVSLNAGDYVEVWVENNDNANDIIVTDFNLLIESIDAIGAAPGAIVVPSQTIFVDGIKGNDLNNGSMDYPLKSYEAARLLAVSRNPQYGSGQTIVVMTTINSTGDFTISPYVSIFGWNKYNCIIGTSGNFVLDPAWGSTPFAESEISNVALIGNSINFVFNTYTDDSIVRFENCSMQLLNAGPTCTITGSDNSGNTNCETVIFNNCSLDLQPGIPEPQFITDNVNLFLFNTAVSNATDVTVSSATVAATLLIQNAVANVANITVNATNTGTLSTQISGCNTANAALTVNGTSNNVQIDADSYKFANYIFSGGASFTNINGGNPQLIYIDQLNGNDNNSGTINYPMQNYEAARLKAIAQFGANLYLIGVVIVVVGNQNVTGDMILTPGISIDSTNPYSSGFIVSDNVVLDPTWGTNWSYVQVRNVYMYVGLNYNYIFPAMDVTGSSYLKFVNCQFNTLGTITITGAGSSSGIENVTFENCTVDFINYIDSYVAENVNLYLVNTDISAGSVTMTVSTALGLNYNLVINNARFFTNDISVITNNTSTLTTYITACNTQGRTLTIDGSNNTVNVDSTSYMFTTLTLSGGATLANLNIPTLSDGMTGNLTPVNYTPTGSSTDKDISVTGHLRGIDGALPKASGNTTLVAGTVTVATSSVAAGDFIGLMPTALGGVPGNLTVSINPGVSFTITSDSISDTSSFKWKNLGA